MSIAAPVFQSNSIRGELLKSVMDSTIHEIIEDVTPFLGPGATDSYIIKNGTPYYTRDGKEVLESLLFDNELALYIHHIFYQAVYNQGHDVGDGSTTLALLYGYLYEHFRRICENTPVKLEDAKDPSPSGDWDSAFLQWADKVKSPKLENLVTCNLNRLRQRWEPFLAKVIKKLEDRAVPMTDDRLLSLLHTCTQDATLAAKIYRDLREPLLAGAYIIPRKSNIASDFNVTVHQRPVIAVTRQWSNLPIDEKREDCAVIYYCNGMIDIAHSETLARIAGSLMMCGNQELRTTIILLGHGITEATRRSIKAFEKIIRDSRWTAEMMNPLAIYTMNDYRKLNSEEIEDIATIISGEEGLGGLVHHITFEQYLYRAFNWSQETAESTVVESLETYDCDEALVEKIRTAMQTPYTVLFDPVNGMAIDRALNPVAQRRYDELRKAIAEEKSPVKKLELSRRLRRSYGMFIDLEVGSTLMKDSQRKFELVLDAIISATEAVHSGLLLGNGLLHLLAVLNDSGLRRMPEAELLTLAVRSVLKTLGENAGYANLDEYCLNKIREGCNLADFNLEGKTTLWPHRISGSTDTAPITVDLDGDIYTIDPTVVDSLDVIRAIVKNSMLPLELVKCPTFHIAGASGFLGNYVDPYSAS